MTASAHPEGLSMLEKRRIEAEILKEVYDTLKDSHGEEVARKTIAESVRRSAIEQARAFAAAAPGGSVLTAISWLLPSRIEAQPETVKPRSAALKARPCMENLSHRDDITCAERRDRQDALCHA